MSWFKVDDAFDDHPKVLVAGNAAIGLWVRCGAYAGRYATEGFIPAEIARAKGTRAEIDRLVKAGLWHRVDGGYRMHDFLDYNPTAEQEKAKRDAAAERQRRKRARDTAGRYAGSHGVTDGSVTPSVTPPRPVPSRPDPRDVSERESSVVTDGPSGPTDDDLQRTLDLIVEAKERGPHGPRTNPRRWRMIVRTDVVTTDGELIRRLLADGTTPEQVALFVLGHGFGAEAEHKADTTRPWCEPSCPLCAGGHWIADPDDPDESRPRFIPCPNREATA